MKTLSDIFWSLLFQKRVDEKGNVLKKPFPLDSALQLFFESSLAGRMPFVRKPEQSRAFQFNATIPDEAWLLSRYEKKKNYIQHIVSLLPAEAKEESFLELGCADMVNLVHLSERGFKNLSGLELNHHFIASGQKYYKDRISHIRLIESSIEQFVKDSESSFDTVFTTAVLQHVNPGANWVFSGLRRICKKRLIVCEAEYQCHMYQFPRNYKRIFERNGFVETHEVVLRRGAFEGAPEDLYGYTLRIFNRQNP